MESSRLTGGEVFIKPPICCSITRAGAARLKLRCGKIQGIFPLQQRAIKDLMDGNLDEETAPSQQLWGSPSFIQQIASRWQVLAFYLVTPAGASELVSEKQHGAEHSCPVRRVDSDSRPL